MAKKKNSSESETETETENTNAEEEGARSFSRFIATLSDGELEHDASIKMKELVSKLRIESKRVAARAKGMLTIKLTYDYEGDACTVGFTIDVKEPKPARGKSMFFATIGGNLTREVPRQEKLPFRVVEGKDQDPKVKEAPDGAGQARSL